jgi:hypothetical protein
MYLNKRQVTGQDKTRRQVILTSRPPVHRAREKIYFNLRTSHLHLPNQRLSNPNCTNSKREREREREICNASISRTHNVKQ